MAFHVSRGADVAAAVGAHDRVAHQVAAQRDGHVFSGEGELVLGIIERLVELLGEGARGAAAREAKGLVEVATQRGLLGVERAHAARRTGQLVLHIRWTQSTELLQSAVDVGQRRRDVTPKSDVLKAGERRVVSRLVCGRKTPREQKIKNGKRKERVREI